MMSRNNEGGKRLLNIKSHVLMSSIYDLGTKAINDDNVRVVLEKVGRQKRDPDNRRLPSIWVD